MQMFILQIAKKDADECRYEFEKKKKIKKKIKAYIVKHQEWTIKKR